MAKEQIKVLKKKLDDAKKARDQVEQVGYDVGVAKTVEALRAELSGVCKAYCLQVWNKALNLVGVKESRECLLPPYNSGTRLLNLLG